MREKTGLTADEALIKLMKLCSIKEMCSYDLRKKMSLWAINESEQNDILKRLGEENFYSDQRYAEAFINDKLKFEKWGSLKIKHSLRSKYIPEKIIDQLLDEIEPDSFREILTDLLEKKYRSLKKGISLEEKKARLYRFAVGRGFDPGLIFELLNKIIR